MSEIVSNNAPPQRIFLDTNVYIVGVANGTSPDWQILHWLGFEQRQVTAPEVIISAEVIEQILRVGKRLQGKDWAGQIVAKIWQNLHLRYVVFDEGEQVSDNVRQWIPREDIGVYLTAKKGGADCFISSNHGLIRAMVEKTQDFQCFSPTEFVSIYLAS